MLSTIQFFLDKLDLAWAKTIKFFFKIINIESNDEKNGMISIFYVDIGVNIAFCVT